MGRSMEDGPTQRDLARGRVRTVAIGDPLAATSIRGGCISTSGRQDIMTRTLLRPAGILLVAGLAALVSADSAEAGRRHHRRCCVPSYCCNPCQTVSYSSSCCGSSQGGVIIEGAVPAEGAVAPGEPVPMPADGGAPPAPDAAPYAPAPEPAETQPAPEAAAPAPEAAPAEAAEEAAPPAPADN
jgi:hypothetical protein